MVSAAQRAPSAARWVVASSFTHVALALALARFTPAPTSRRPAPRLDAVEVELRDAADLVVPQRVASLSPPAPAPPPRPEARPTRVALRGAARPASAPPPTPSPIAPPAPTPAPSAPPPPPPTPPTVQALPPPPAPSLRAAELFRAGEALSLRAAAASAPSLEVSAPLRDRTLFAGTGADPLGHARRALSRDLRDGLAAGMTRDAPGVRAYLSSVRRRMNEAWRPGVVRVPNLAETLAASFGINSRQVEAMNRWWRERQQAMHQERDRGGAIDAIESIGGAAGRGSEGLSRMPNDSLREAWRRNTRITRAEVRVDQDPNGRVLEVRVVRTSGSAAFDRAALDAVRAGLEQQDPIPLPGGRRSRWSFTVVATRRLIAANIGGAFDESRGWFQIQLPGSVSMRSRVFMESSEPIPTDDT